MIEHNIVQAPFDVMAPGARPPGESEASQALNSGAEQVESACCPEESAFHQQDRELPTLEATAEEASGSGEAPCDFSTLLNVDRDERGVDEKIPFKDSGRDYALPHLEVTVLKIALSKPALFPKIARELEAGDFYYKTHCTIFHAMLHVVSSGKPLVHKNLRHELDATWPESQQEWQSILNALADSSAWHKHLGRCIAKLKEAAAIRGGKDYCPHSYSEDFCARLFMCRIPMIRCVSNSWFTYGSGVWRAVQKDVFRPEAIGAIHPKERSARRCRDVLDHAESLRQFVGEFRGAYGFDCNRNILLNTANCVVCITPHGDITQLEHPPDFDFTLKLAAEFLPNARCDLFRSKLEESLPDPNDRELFQAFCGYILEPSCKREIALVAYGPAGTGKSTLALGAGDVLGPDLLCSAGLEDLCKSGSYALPGLKNKMLNLGSELSGTATVESANFKKLVSGEAMNVRQIYGAPEDMKTKCKLFFLTNNPPMFQGGTDAEARRLRILHFDQKPLSVDVDLKEKLAAERSGILNWMLEGLVMLLQTGKIPEGGVAAKRVLDSFRKNNDPVGSFLAERCKLGGRGKIRKQELSTAFAGWCEENGHASDKMDAMLWKTVKQRHPELIETRRLIKGDRVRFISGISLVDSPDEPPQGRSNPAAPTHDIGNRPGNNTAQKLLVRLAASMDA
jgi:P4 family phage/plasmid primase-like protien